MWIGGLVPIGYDVTDRRLVVNPTEAATVRGILNQYLELGSVRLLMQDLNHTGIRSKVRVAKNGKRSGGHPFLRGALYELLSNRFTSVRFHRGPPPRPARSYRGSRVVESAQGQLRSHGSECTASEEIGYNWQDI